MDAQALQAIETKLRRQQITMERQRRMEVPIDWPSPQEVKVHSTAVQAAETVDMLQRRSRQSGAVPDPATAPGPSPRPSANRRISPAAQQRRLAALVQRINDLSLAQEQIMAEMQRVPPRVSPSSHDQPTEGAAINLDQAITAWARLETSGQVVLSYRPVEPLPNPEALALARHLRRTYGAPQGLSFPGDLGRMVRQWLPWITQSIPPGLPQPADDPALGSTEAMLWAGAGVVGRLVIQGILATLPSLGLVAVMAGLASLALVLYRAALPPTPKVHRILRVGLALAGLIIGGYLI